MIPGANAERSAARAPRGGVTKLVGVLLLTWLSTPCFAREKEPKSIRVVGVVQAVDSTRLIIRGSEGTQVELVTPEDLSGKLALGAQIGAWYFDGGGVNVLERLETPGEPVVAQAPPTETNIRKVIILPSSAVPDTEGIFDAIAAYLESHLHWYVAPRVLAEEIRSRNNESAATSALDALDSSTGEFDMAKYLGARHGLVEKLASETRVDAVLGVHVEEVMAKVKRRMAAWDGVEEPISSKGARTIARFAIVPERGQVSACTVILKLWDAQGNLLWSNRRGFAVLVVLAGMGNKFRPRPLSEVLEDRATVERWMAATFASLPAEAASAIASGKGAR